MRRPLIAGNWKMNLDRESAVALAAAIAQRTREIEEVDIGVFPPFMYLLPIGDALRGSRIKIGGQNMYHESSGAFTGEVSAPMLVDVGCTYVILGHSERRHVLGENDESINKKVHAALAAGLAPIVCVGELLSEREGGKTAEVIRRQFDGSLAGLSADQMRSTLLAYEPVWAIGTGKVATPAQAEEVHSDLRRLIADRYNAEIANSVRIQYGGSVKPSNAAELLGQPNVDGALVGGASLVAEDFVGIIEAAAR